jgi:hypothetical protein
MMTADLLKSSGHNGIGSHQSAAMINDEWLTPPHVLKALGPFDLDPCACTDPRPWPTAREHYTRADNGILREWHGRVFLNPPYGGPTIVGPWMRRMVAHGNGIALVFARTETDIFHECVWQVASAILFLRGRLFFHYADGRKASANAGAPSCLIAYGSHNAGVLMASGLPGAWLAL